LQFNDTLSYRCGTIAPQNPTASPQLESEAAYSGKVVDFTDDGMVGVRADGWWGDAPLYYVRPEDILSVAAASPPTVDGELHRELE
jgi:hypothetical protein